MEKEKKREEAQGKQRESLLEFWSGSIYIFFGNEVALETAME